MPPSEFFTLGVLPTNAHRFSNSNGHANISWEPGDPLDDLFRVWIGDFGSDAYADELRTWFRSNAVEVRIPLGGTVPAIGEALTPIDATGVGIRYSGGIASSAVVVVGSDASDLVRLWNCRAMGADVLPWPIGSHDRFKDVLEHWLSRRRMRGES